LILVIASEAKQSIAAKTVRQWIARRFAPRNDGESDAPKYVARMGRSEIRGRRHLRDSRISLRPIRATTPRHGTDLPDGQISAASLNLAVQFLLQK
jgi:hypothetical protein